MSTPIEITPPAPQPVRATLELTPEQTETLIDTLLPLFELPEGVTPSMLQSVAAHKADSDGGCSLDLVFNPAWPVPEPEE